jgi:hypothetical protein
VQLERNAKRLARIRFKQQRKERRQQANRLIVGAVLSDRYEYGIDYCCPAAVGCGNYRLASQSYAVRKSRRPFRTRGLRRPFLLSRV